MTEEQAAIVIRRATIEDAAGISRVHVDSWRETYRGIMPDDVLDGLSYDGRAETRRRQMRTAAPEVIHLVAELDGQIVGFAVAGPERETDFPYEGELYAIYILRSAQGRGIGRQLFAAAVSHLLRHGIDSMLVWVLADNPSRGFYEALGGAELGVKTITIGVPLEEVAYGWDDIRPPAGCRSGDGQI